MSSHTEIELTDSEGMSVTLSTLGAAIRDIKTATGQQLALGYDNEQDWQANPFHFGVTVGRVANRICQGRYKLGQETVQLVCNDGGNHHLHGGTQGLGQRQWTLSEHDSSKNFACFTYISEAGEQGYPTRVVFRVEYRLAKGQLDIDMYAEPDAPTPISLTNHIYWNLSAADSLNVFDHHIMIPATRRLAKDNQDIPNGEIIELQGSRYDFGAMRSLQCLEESAGGFDDYFVIDSEQNQAMRLHAKIRAPKSNTGVDIYSNAPGCQFYTGRFLNDTCRHVDGRPLAPYAGLCVEPHEYPNAVNHAHFPSTVYGPSRPYHHRLRFNFHLPSPERII